MSISTNTNIYSNFTSSQIYSFTNSSSCLQYVVYSVTRVVQNVRQDQTGNYPKLRKQTGERFCPTCFVFMTWFQGYFKLIHFLLFLYFKLLDIENSHSNKIYFVHGKTWEWKAIPPVVGNHYLRGCTFITLEKKCHFGSLPSPCQKMLENY